MILFFVLSLVLQNILVVRTQLNVPNSKYALDLDLFENVLDAEMCEEQLLYLRNNPENLLPFLDAGARISQGILTGNLLDLGNYYQCLAISQEIPESVVEGKYCMIKMNIDQGIDLSELAGLSDLAGMPDIPWLELIQQMNMISNETLKRRQEYEVRKAGGNALIGSQRSFRSNDLQLALCIPKTCTTRQFVDSLVSIESLQFQETFCRLPNDKPWVPADYVAIIIFSILGILLIASTIYDIKYNFFAKRDPTRINKLYQSFSVYNNTRRLVTYIPVAGNIECLDGIRSIALLWVIIGHTFVIQLISGLSANPLDAMNWMTSLKAVWITAAPITVDTFFMISGLLLVYTLGGKMTGMNLLKNLHMFYLNRIFRIIPILAVMVLLQASLLNWVTDGPYWEHFIGQIHVCRMNWWSTLLHVQNYVTPMEMCLPHTWYLAIDMQLYILSPIVIVWAFGRSKRIAWVALFGSILAVLTAATTYIFIKKLPATSFNPAYIDQLSHYMEHYYMNTLTRASPFMVGLIFGYILHINRAQDFYVSKIYSTILWICAFAISFLAIYAAYPTIQLDWKNELADGFINSFMRPAWALSLGWLIFACQHGYAGPINWFLSLRAWKVLSRLSYAMYIVHYPLILLVDATLVAPIYFSVQFSIFKFFGDFIVSILAAFLVSLMVDSPCSVIVKHFMNPGRKRPVKEENITYAKETDKDLSNS